MMVPFSTARARHLRVGRRGENAACGLLKSKKYCILARNFKRSSGEIDIVARDGAGIVFVEVKTRMKRTGARPASGLSGRQKSRINRAARVFMKEIENPPVIYRFDLIEVVLDRFGVSEMRHWLEHFMGAEMYRYDKKEIF
jgi:putative endonuclease